MRPASLRRAVPLLSVAVVVARVISGYSGSHHLDILVVRLPKV